MTEAERIAELERRLALAQADRKLLQIGAMVGAIVWMVFRG